MINAVTSTALGLIVYLNNRSNIVNKTFSMFAFYVALWSYPYIFWPLVHSKEACLFWFRMLHIGAIFIPVGFYHFVVSFLQKGSKKLVIIGYILSVIFVGFVFTNYFIPDMRPVGTLPYYGIPGILYVPFLGMFFLYAYGSIYLLFSGYREADVAKKPQILFVGIGTLIGFTGGSSNYLPWFNIEIPPVFNILVAIYVVMTAYAIIKHRFLDIEVIIKKTLVFAGLLASVFAMLVLPTLLIQEYIFRGAGVGGKITGLLISGMIIIISLRKIEDFLINVTDKFLFQKKYDYKELLRTFTSEVLTVLDLNKLVKLTVDKLSDIVKLQSCGILLLDEGKAEYGLIASQGIKEKNITLRSDNTLTSFLMRTKDYLSIKSYEKKYALPKRIIDDMNRLKFELAFPLITLQGEMVGILTLGKKKSDEDYTQDDIDILVPLARTLAIAISNAEMFVELGKTQAEAAQREKMAVIGTLSAGINHEICNPLGIARGQCEAFLLNVRDGLYKGKSPEELVEKAQTIMQKVIHETDRATSITKRLSSFAKPSKGVISDDINIKDEIDEVLALVSYELKMDKIDIVKEVDPDIPFISADKKALQEVFFNLVRNSAQAIAEKGRIVIRAKGRGGKVVIDIEDTGHGIPEDKLETIFNPFYTTKEPGKGTGLGLFIVRQVVEKNKGKISVKSKVDEGTTFTLEFPISVKEKVKK